MAKPQDLAVGEWWKVPRVGNSHLADVYATPNPGGTQAAVMDAWGAMALDTSRDDALFFGGGHADYSGNEVYAFNINTLVFRRKTFPSTPDTDNNDTYADGSPSTGHTYSSLVYFPDIDKMVMGPGRARWNDGSTSPNAWTFDCTTESPNTAAPSAWVQKDAAPASGNIYANFVYDPVSKRAFNQDGAGASGMQWFDPTLGGGSQWTQVETGGASGVQSDSATCAKSVHSRGCWHNSIDGSLVVRRLIGQLGYEGTEDTFGCTGATAILTGALHPGLTWDSGAGKLVMYGGTQAGGTDNRDVYLLDMTTKVITRVTGTGDTPPNLPGGSNGWFSRFQNLEDCGPDWKGLNLLVNSTTDDVYFYRSSSANAAPPFEIGVRDTTSIGLANRTNTTLTAPRVQNGDMLVAILAAGDSGDTNAPSVTPPAGFTELAGFPSKINQATYAIALHVYTKLAASESGNYTFTHAAADSEGVMYSVKNGRSVTVAPTVASGTGATVTATGLTPARNGALLIWAGLTWDFAGPSAPSTGTTPSFNESYDTSAAGVLYVQDGIMVTAAATGNKSVTTPNGAGNPWTATLISIELAVSEVTYEDHGAVTGSPYALTGDMQTGAVEFVPGADMERGPGLVTGSPYSFSGESLTGGPEFVPGAAQGPGAVTAGTFAFTGEMATGAPDTSPGGPTVVSAPVVTHTYTVPAPKISARVAPAQVTHTYTARTPQVRVSVKPGAALHTYTGQTPQVRAKVAPPAATHTYTGRVPVITSGATVLAPAATHTYTARTPQVAARVMPAQATHTYTGRNPQVRMSVRPLQASHTYTAVAPKVQARVAPAAVLHTYAGKLPQIRAKVMPGAALHTYSGRVPAVIAGGTNNVSPPQATHTYSGRVPVVNARTTVAAVRALHTYTALVPRVSASVRPSAALHLYSSKVPLVFAGVFQPTARYHFSATPTSPRIGLPASSPDQARLGESENSPILPRIGQKENPE